ncbi:hypothetical protein H7849_11820 [Alloacidobacterium dinghuense]|uniref:Uncharacterized protein n=1 Tax=Alloacidobacterium dinghuense TaxID=2763107 RepID=A0A7G8BPP3_9BACT|nr:hypothetical protein [Alloacidobacterium dinghuense]QNI34513.1 hypothetical protein H7849_11820 [Alloacidobacterium dinghuense]
MRSAWTQHAGPDSSESLQNSQSRIRNGGQAALNFERRRLDPAGYNDDSLVRESIAHAIKGCSKSREQIADEMTLLLGVRVTERMLNSFTADANQLHRWPAAWDRAFCQATGDDALLVCRVQRAGLHVITPTEYELLELGREYLRQKRAAQEVERLEKRLSGVDL